MSVTVERMREVAGKERSISDKIRALDQLGASRREIADHLSRSYQHVRQVLVEDARRRGERGPPVAAGIDPSAGRESSGRVGEGSGSAVGPSFRIRIGEDGSVAIPPEATKALGFHPRSVVIAHVEDGALVLSSAASAMAKAQAIVRARVPAGISLADDLLAERRGQND